MLKQSFDIIASLIGIICFTPLFLLIAVLIKLDSPGPVFFRQPRVGQNGKIFLIHKFRTMYVNSEQQGVLTSGSSDTRITQVGSLTRKLHLDEAIQLLDVLAGNMSLVGPRPETPNYTEYYKAQWAEVLKVKPGITGLAVLRLSRWEYQLLEHAKNSNTTYINSILPKKLRLECFYARKHNFIFDLRLLLTTIIHLFKKD